MRYESRNKKLNRQPGTVKNRIYRRGDIYLASVELYILQALQAPASAGACFFRRTLNEIKKQRIMYRNGSWVYMPIPLLLTKAPETVYYNNRYITIIIKKEDRACRPKQESRRR